MSGSPLGVGWWAVVLLGWLHSFCTPFSDEIGCAELWFVFCTSHKHSSDFTLDVLNIVCADSDWFLIIFFWITFESPRYVRGWLFWPPLPPLHLPSPPPPPSCTTVLTNVHLFCKIITLIIASCAIHSHSQRMKQSMFCSRRSTAFRKTMDHTVVVQCVGASSYLSSVLRSWTRSSPVASFQETVFQVKVLLILCGIKLINVTALYSLLRMHQWFVCVL